MTKKTLQQILDEQRAASPISKKSVKAINSTHQNAERRHDAEYQKKFKDMMASDEYRQKVRAATQTPEHRKTKSEQSKKLWQDPEYKLKQHAALTTPESRAKQSAAARRREADPEFARKKRERLKETYKDPERNRKVSEAVKKRFENPAAREHMSRVQKEIAANRTKEDYDRMHQSRLASGWAEKIAEAGRRKRKSIIAGGIPFASRMDAIRHYGFDPAMIQYNIKHHPDTWYYITQDEYAEIINKQTK